MNSSIARAIVVGKRSLTICAEKRTDHKHGSEHVAAQRGDAARADKTLADLLGCDWTRLPL